MAAELTPADKDRCQALVPGNGPFTMGGPIGDPCNGYRVRCPNVPTVIVYELLAGPDGLKGSMSLCAGCLKVFSVQKGTPAVRVETLLPTRGLPTSNTPPGSPYGKGNDES